MKKPTIMASRARRRVKKPTILADVQAQTVREMEAARRNAVNAVKVAAWHAQECRAALAPRAVGQADIAVARSALAEIAKSITAARQALDIQREIIGTTARIIGAETPEQIDGREKGTRAANEAQSKRSAEVAAAIRAEWDTTSGNQTTRCNAVKKRFTKKAEAARINGERDEIAERISKASHDTILRAVNIRTK